MAESESIRKRILRRFEELDQERGSWTSHWDELGSNFAPRRRRFQASETNVGTKRNTHLLDATPLFCARTLASGMLTGLTSPTRPWFRIGTPNPALMDQTDVRLWCNQIEELLRWAFAKSNLYNALPTLYNDLGVFGTGVLFVDEDPRTVIRCEVWPIGTYWLAAGPDQRVDTCYRRVSFTVRNLVKKFGLKNCSERVKELHKEGRLEQWISVIHAIQPRRDALVSGRLVPATEKPIESIYIEEQGEEDQPPLRVSGYDEMPILAVRFDTVGEDVYGCGPGMEALGDAKSLQKQQEFKLEALEKDLRPPLMAPSTLRGDLISVLPGALNWVPPSQMGQGIEPLFRPTLNLRDLRETIEDTRALIRASFFTDLLLMMGLAPRSRQMTAREVDERHEEKLLQLGGVLQRVSSEVLTLLIDRTFNILERGGVVPPAPSAIRGLDLKIEFISILHQAQQLIHLLPIEKLVEMVAMMAQLDPKVVQKLDLDEIVDEASRLLGTTPKVVVSDEKLAAQRAALAEQQRMAQGLAAAQAGAQTAKDLAAAPLDTNSTLDRLLAAYQGGATAPAA